MAATAAVNAPDPETRAGRPVAVTVVTVLAVTAALYSFWVAATIFRDADGDDVQIVRGLVNVGLGLLAIAVGVGALGMRPWAWKLFMTLAVVGLTYQILNHFSFGDPRYWSMAIYAFIVFALTPRDVQVAFRIREPPNAQLDRPTRNPLDRD